MAPSLSAWYRKLCIAWQGSHAAAAAWRALLRRAGQLLHDAAGLRSGCDPARWMRHDLCSAVLVAAGLSGPAREHSSNGCHMLPPGVCALMAWKCSAGYRAERDQRAASAGWVPRCVARQPSTSTPHSPGAGACWAKPGRLHTWPPRCTAASAYGRTHHHAYRCMALAAESAWLFLVSSITCCIKNCRCHPTQPKWRGRRRGSDSSHSTQRQQQIGGHSASPTLSPPQQPALGSGVLLARSCAAHNRLLLVQQHLDEEGLRAAARETLPCRRKPAV